MVPFALILSPVRSYSVLTLLYLGVGLQIAALRPIPWRRGHQSAVDSLLIATGLTVPGAGVAIVAWLAVFDGRIPGRTITWWAFLFNRAMLATAYVVPSIAVSSFGHDLAWLPLQTLVYVVTALSLNYTLTALGWAFVSRVSLVTTLFENVGVTALFGTAALSFAGGIIYLLLQTGPVGYIMAPGLFAFVLAVRGNVAEVGPLVRHHHERWDGSGYPAGLKGDVIPFGARILSVADSFDTITGARLYRRSLMTPIEGVEDISRRASQWYDPNVVDALRELHGLQPLEVLNRPEVPRRITTLRVLRSNPSFSSLVAAIGISSLGDPLTQVASLISIYVKTNHDARFVALGFIVQAIATIVMTSLAGGLADRLPRRGLV